jgi:hypothetical protein
MVGKTALDPPLVKLRIIQGAERPRQSPERPDQPELGGDEVNGKPKPYLLRKRESVLGFALRLGKRVAVREQVRVQLVAAVGCALRPILLAASNARRTSSRPARTCRVGGRAFPSR